jgi:regulator of replication initiation timing
MTNHIPDINQIIRQLKREIDELKIRVTIVEEDNKILQLQLDLTQDSIDAIFDL